jgi:hypothetical protein
MLLRLPSGISFFAVCLLLARSAVPSNGWLTITAPTTLANRHFQPILPTWLHRSVSRQESCLLQATAAAKGGFGGAANISSKEVKLKPKQQWDRYTELKKETAVKVAVRVVSAPTTATTAATEDSTDSAAARRNDWLHVGSVKSSASVGIEMAVARQRALIAEVRVYQVVVIVIVVVVVVVWSSVYFLSWCVCEPQESARAREQTRSASCNAHITHALVVLLLVRRRVALAHAIRSCGCSTLNDCIRFWCPPRLRSSGATTVPQAEATTRTHTRWSTSQFSMRPVPVSKNKLGLKASPILPLDFIAYVHIIGYHGIPHILQMLGPCLTRALSCDPTAQNRCTMRVDWSRM